MKKFELGRLMCTVILGTSFLTGSAYAEENLSEFVLDGINVTALGKKVIWIRLLTLLFIQVSS